jgi:hypothetical protein
MLPSTSITIIDFTLKTVTSNNGSRVSAFSAFIRFLPLFSFLCFTAASVGGQLFQFRAQNATSAF